uniref:Spermatogenesis associated 32 n=1 Tax=Rattus norvegicus TaxID=10116 RepID=A0ABK0LZT4_RAT
MQRLCVQMRPGLYPPRTAVYIPGLLRSGQLPAPSLGPGELAARPPRHKRSSRVPTHILGMNLQVSCKSPGRNVTEATASQAPAPPSSSAPLHPASQRAHWRRRGSRHQPAPRLPDRASVSMGVTGFSAFPCCGKNSVNIVERKNDDYHHHHHPLEDNKDEDNEMGTELSSMKPPPKVDPDPVPHLEDMVTELTSTPIPETENPEQQNYRIESIKPYEEELTTTNTFKPRGFNVNSTNKEEEEVVCGHFRSTPVQTSKHLFWSNKLIQASEHSLQTALEKHHKSPGEKKSISIAQVYTECTQRPSSTQVSRTPTPTALGLADLINFASSLAVASSSNMALPNLGTMIKGTSEKAQNTSLDFCQPIQSIKFTQATQITQISSEKQDEPPEVMAHKSWTQETRNVACSYLDINESGLKKATIQGEVKFVQAPATSPELQEDKDDSTNDSLLPLTPRQLTAFQDIFKLFSCSPTGTVDMHSMKVALRNVGIQLGPQEMCEALRLADLDGDGIVSFKDFLGVLTDNHRLAQCMSEGLS